MLKPLNVRQIFLQSVDRHADRIALVEGARSTTFRELGERVDALAAALVGRGLGGSRVGILLPNSGDFVVALYAVLAAGSTAVLLNPLCARREIALQVEETGVRFVLGRPEAADALPESVSLLPPSAAGQAGIAEAPEDIDENDEAVIIYTSAMEGRSRGAILTHRNLATNASATATALGLKADDRVVGALPFCHAFGLTVSLIASCVVGAAVIPVERFSPLTTLEIISSGDASVMIGVPGVYGALLSVAERRAPMTNRLRIALCGGAPLPLQLIHRWESAAGIPLRQGYGLTEASPVCLFNQPDGENRPGTLGTALPGVSVTIRDREGAVLPDGEVGEICVEGPNVFHGYVDGGPHSVHDGILRTGDLGVANKGVIRFQGILKKMFTRNGFNIYPMEIRAVLEQDPRIRRADVFARPDPLRENEILLMITPEVAGGIDEAAIKVLCRDQLASYKQPGEIRITGNP